MSRVPPPDVVVEPRRRAPGPRRRRGAGRPAGRRPGGARHGLGRAHRRRDRHRRPRAAWPHWRPSRSGRSVDWTAVDVWWGDERFVPADDDERNEKQARDGPAGPRRRARTSGSTRCRRRTGRSPSPRTPPPGTPPSWPRPLPEGTHCPGSTSCCSAWAPRGTWPRSSRSRPPSRTTGRSSPSATAPSRRRPGSASGFAAINAAEEVWLIVSGAAKAPAVAQALAGADPARAAGGRGARRPGHALAAGRGGGRRAPGQALSALTDRGGTTPGRASRQSCPASRPPTHPPPHANRASAAGHARPPSTGTSGPRPGERRHRRPRSAPGRLTPSGPAARCSRVSASSSRASPSASLRRSRT